jgi:hypothetical protein
MKSMRKSLLAVVLTIFDEEKLLTSQGDDQDRVVGDRDGVLLVVLEDYGC